METGEKKKVWGGGKSDAWISHRQKVTDTSSGVRAGTTQERDALNGSHNVIIIFPRQTFSQIITDDSPRGPAGSYIIQPPRTQNDRGEAWSDRASLDPDLAVSNCSCGAICCQIGNIAGIFSFTLKRQLTPKIQKAHIFFLVLVVLLIHRNCFGPYHGIHFSARKKKAWTLRLFLIHQ